MTITTSPNQRRKVVFIMGYGHSGSTILSLLLGSHSAAFIVGELSQMVNIHRRRHRLGELRSLLRLRATQPQVCVMCEEPCAYWHSFNLYWLAASLRDPRDSRLLNELFRLLRRVYRPYTRLLDHLPPGETVLIDMSKSPDWIAYHLAGPDFTSGTVEGYVLFITRDGRAVVNSNMRKRESRDIRQTSQNFANRMHQMQVFYDSLPPERRFTVRYEALATAPAEQLTAICTWLGLDYEPEMLHYWVKDFHPIGGNAGAYNIIWKSREIQEERMQRVREANDSYYDTLDAPIQLDLRWKDELSPELLAVFEEIAGDVNEALRYDG